MITNPENHQGRARGLYDEQLQRQKQEKMLHQGQRAPAAGDARAVVPTHEDH